MSLYGHNRPTTPFLDELRDELVVFSQFKAIAPWTLPTHATIFTGVPPAEHRAQWGTMKLAEEAQTLAEILSARGFCTTGFSANPLVKPGNGLAQGFEQWEHVGGPWTSRTQEILSRVPEVLRDAQERNCRAFLFLNLMDTHIPYNTERFGEDFGADGPGPIKNAAVKWAVNGGARQLSAGEWESHRNSYDAAVRAADAAAEELSRILVAEGESDRSLVIFTSDHGEGLGSHPEVGHSISVWEEQLSVPLAVRFPNGKLQDQYGGLEISSLHGQLELAPSILDWLAVARPDHLTATRNLLDDGERAVFADYRSYFSEGNRKTNVKVASNYPDLAERIKHQHVAYCDGLKLIASEDGAKAAFALKTDPHEQIDVVGSGSDPELRRCVAMYQQLGRDGRLTPFDAEDLGSEDEPDLDALRSLGYVQ
jgi:arylsulfatase A-like enzyme